MQTVVQMSKEVSSVKPWYKHIWPWLLLAGPASVVVAGAYTSWLAYSQPDALVVDDYYKQGKAINQDLRRDRAAANLNLKSNIGYDAAAGKVIGTISSHGAPYTGKIRLHLVHSTLPEKDINLEAQAGSNGEFGVALPMLEKAHWQVLMENADREWRLNGTWTWPQQQKIEITAEPQR